MARKKEKNAPPSRAEVVKAVRVFGGINLCLGLYMILGALTALGDMNLPGSAAKLMGGTLGAIAVVVGWGSAAASGLGLILITQWGRKLAVFWGKIIVWMLPIAFGLSADGVSDFFSFAFIVIIVICLYASVISQNLARPEFDTAFEPE